jgi:hypothetical protein
MALLGDRFLREDDAHAGLVMAGTWATAFAAYAAAGWWGSRRELAHADELAVPGLVVPSIGVALMYPLTVHLPIALLTGVDGLLFPLSALTSRSVLLGGASAFDAWSRITLVITGPTYLLLAVLVADRAVQLARGKCARTPMAIYGICLTMTCVLYLMMFTIPPLIVAVTALPALGLMEWMQRIADGERAAACSAPRAIVVAAPRA